jgi:hypothetical protein
LELVIHGHQGFDVLEQTLVEAGGIVEVLAMAKAMDDWCY